MAEALIVPENAGFLPALALLNTYQLTPRKTNEVPFTISSVKLDPSIAAAGTKGWPLHCVALPPAVAVARQTAQSASHARRAGFCSVTRE